MMADEEGDFMVEPQAPNPDAGKAPPLAPPATAGGQTPVITEGAAARVANILAPALPSLLDPESRKQATEFVEKLDDDEKKKVSTVVLIQLLDKELENLLVYYPSGYFTTSQIKDYEKEMMVRFEAHLQTTIKTKGLFTWEAEEPDKRVLYNNGQGASAALDSNALSRDEKNELMELDGLYLTKADLELNNDNIKRLEQRLLNSKDYAYFREDNKELKLDNKLFDSKLFRKTDISIMKNSYHSLISRNAVICERLNQKKKTYYQIEMFVGTLQLDCHPLFEEEDHLAAKLRAQMRSYKDKVDKSLIPHYSQVIQEQQEIIQEMKSNPSSKQSDLALIHKQMHETVQKVKHEQAEIHEIMTEAYSTWKRIKSVRRAQRYTSSEVKLQVHTFKNDQEREEQYLVLDREDVTDKCDDISRSALPSNEASRRAKLKELKFFLKIYINGTQMAQTEPCVLQWPSQEVRFNIPFQILVYTKPYSISIEVCSSGLINEVLDKIEVEVPGEHSNSLTSASKIRRIIQYQKKKMLALPKAPVKNIPQKGKEFTPIGEVDPNKPAGSDKPADGNPNPNSNELVKRINDEDAKTDGENSGLMNVSGAEPEQPTMVVESGRLYVEVGWLGFGPVLPPLNTGGFGIFRQRKKDKKGYHSLPQNSEELLKDEVLIDVNDPRNNEMVERVREIRNNYLRSLLKNDMKLPLHDVGSIRHQLMLMQVYDPDRLKGMRIPLLEEEVIQDKPLISALEKYFEEKRIEAYDKMDYKPAESYNLKSVRLMREVFPFSPDAQKRISETKAIIGKKMSQITRVSDNSDSVNLNQVIREFRFEDEGNQCMVALKSILEENRKFRIARKVQKKESPNQFNTCNIGVQIIKGLHLPARQKSSRLGLRGLEGIGQNDLKQSMYQSQLRMGLDRSVGAGMNLPDAPGARASLLNSQGPNSRVNKLQAYDEPNTMVQVAIDDPEDKEYPPAVTHMTERSPQVTQLGEDAIKINSNQTRTFEGMNPEWNQNLTLEYQTKDGRNFKNSDLQKNDATLIITVFDSRIHIDGKKLNQQQAIVMLEKLYIGSIKIPLTSLFNNPKIDAVFKLERPLYLFGYMTPKKREESEEMIDPFTPSYVMLSLTCDPHFELPETKDSIYFPGFEPTQLLLSGKAFLEEFYKDMENSGRNVRLWGFNLQGKSVFLPRFLRPLEPPKDLFTFDDGINFETLTQPGQSKGPGIQDIKEDAIYQKCARFVSLIPTKADSAVIRDLPDVFLTCQEFLDLLSGGFEEHAILLCNYFLHIDHVKRKNLHIESSIIMGRGVPEGKTFYVLRRDTQTDRNELWNPVTGDLYLFKQQELKTKFMCFDIKTGFTQRSSTVDTICQLKFIDAIVTPKNVYLNIQQDKTISGTKWDVNDPKCFQPFLSEVAWKNFFASGMESVQKEIEYEVPSQDFILRLEDKISQYIGNKIEEHRYNQKSPFVTTWNKNLSQEIKGQLLLFENFKYLLRPAYGQATENQAKKKKAEQQLRYITDIIMSQTQGKEFYGFPLNIPFISVDQVWDEVRNTEIHNILQEDIQYVLSVAIMSYPNYVLSVWVYVAVLYESN